MPAIDPSIVVDEAMNDAIRRINRLSEKDIFSLAGQRIHRPNIGAWYFEDIDGYCDVFRLWVYESEFDTYMRAHYPEFFL